MRSPWILLPNTCINPEKAFVIHRKELGAESMWYVDWLSCSVFNNVPLKCRQEWCDVVCSLCSEASRSSDHHRGRYRRTWSSPAVDVVRHGGHSVGSEGTVRFHSLPSSVWLFVCLIMHQHMWLCVCVCVLASNCHFLQTLRSSFSYMWTCSLQVGAHWKLLVVKWKPLWYQDTVCVPVCVSFLKRWYHRFQMCTWSLQVSAHWELVVAKLKPLCVCQYVSLSSNVEIINFICEIEVYKK